MKITMSEKRERGSSSLGIDNEWVRDVVIDREIKGVDLLRLQIVRIRGKRVRIPYKPRGENIGYIWHSTVRDSDTAHILWSGKVPKSYGVRGILRLADLIL